MVQHMHARVESGIMAQAKFFDERTDQSEVKARIIQKYFYAWAKVIIPSAKHREKKIAYIDCQAHRVAICASRRNYRASRYWIPRGFSPFNCRICSHLICL